MTRIGILFNTDRIVGSDFLDYGRRVEAAGIESVWLAELFGREPFAASGALLGATSTLKVGTAIANRNAFLGARLTAPDHQPKVDERRTCRDC